MSTTEQPRLSTPWWDRPWFALTAIALLAYNLRPTAISVGPVLRSIQADLGMNDATAGLLTSLPALCFAVFGAAAAFLAGRFGAHRVTAAAVCCIAAGAWARAFAPTTSIYLALSAVSLAGMAVANVVIPSLVKRHFPRAVSLVTAVYSTALQIGVVVPSMATVPLAHALGGWRHAFAWCSLTAVIALLPWLVLARDDRGYHPSTAHGARISLRQVGRTKLGWYMAIFFGFQSTQAYSIFGWLSSMYQNAGISETYAGLLLGIATGVGLPLSFILPAYTARNPSPYRLLLLINACAVVGYLGLLLAPATIPWLWAVFIALGTSSFPLILASFGLHSRTPQGTAALSGFTQSVGYVIAAIGPFLIGMLRQTTGGFTWPLLVLLGCTIPLTACGLLSLRPGYIEDALGDTAAGVNSRPLR